MDYAFIIEFDDNTVMDQYGNSIDVSDWYEGMMYNSVDEANRYASEHSNGRKWRLIYVNPERSEAVHRTDWITSSQAAGYKIEQEYLFDPRVKRELGIFSPETTPPTGRWKKMVNIADIINEYNDHENLELVKIKLTDKLKSGLDKEEFEDIKDIIDGFQESVDLEDADNFDYWLNELYEWADNTRVWLGL